MLLLDEDDRDPREILLLLNENGKNIISHYLIEIERIEAIERGERPYSRENVYKTIIHTDKNIKASYDYWLSSVEKTLNKLGYSFTLPLDSVYFDSDQPSVKRIKYYLDNFRNAHNLVQPFIASVTIGLKQTPASGPIGYDDEHMIVSYGGKKEILFEAHTIEAILFKKVHIADGAKLNFENIERAIDEDRLIERYDGKEISYKTLRNTKDRINDKFMKKFGIGNVVCYEKLRYWLNLKYISIDSVYRITEN